ncbi:MAG TPA: glycosyltransferase family 2 protein [Prolixibacteraceae bacterium]|nr:glycosyltransferase family 2 protein [Prolixibacteraceae bacterium]
MRISIITATYNSIQHLPDVLESIRQQTYQNIEYIVIDGGSTDGTVEYLKQSNLVTQIISEPDEGIYDALNKGIRMATGELIGFLHSDDLFASPQTLENIVHAFKEDKEEISVIYGDLVFIDQQNTTKVVRYWKSQPFKRALLQRGWMPPHPTIFLRREVYEKHGLFNINLKCAADYDYILRVFRDTTLKIVYLPEVITKMRMGGMSTGGIKNLINKKKEDYWVLKHNNMPYPLWILFAKNVSKIPQLILRK